MKKPLKVCIVGLKCYDLLAGAKVPRFIGGIETQLVLLAKGLVNEGCDVSLITYDHGQPDEETLEGVRIVKAYDPERGIRGVRWPHRARRLWSAMNRADAEIYLQMGAGVETGLVGYACRKRNRRARRFVFCFASDANYGRHIHDGLFGGQGKLYCYGLRRACLIVAQTERQRRGLQEALNLQSRVIQMAADCPANCGLNRSNKGARHRIIWVGRVSREKRLEWLLEIAHRCPELKFQIVGTANGTSEYATRLVEQARRIQNVEVIGRLAPQDMHSVYENADILCNTSLYEGFPTTFLEAWSYGLPVVTTFNCDNLVQEHGIGRVASNVDGIVSALRELRDNPEAYQHISRRARAYYDKNHSVSVVSRRFRETFEMLVLGERSIKLTGSAISFRAVS